MTRAALIQSGRVVNLVAANPEDVGPSVVVVPDGLPVAIGWTWDGLVFAPSGDPPAVPQWVDMVQAKKALILADKLSIAFAVLQALPEPQKSLAMVDWDHAPRIHRSNALVLAATQALGGSDAVDQLFITAATLS